MARYTDQYGRELHVPDMDDHRKQHRAAKYMAKALLTPLELAAYEAGSSLWVVDELGRKHWLIYAAPGRLLGKG